MDKENIPKSDNIVTSTPIIECIGEEPLPIFQLGCGHAKTEKYGWLLDPIVTIINYFDHRKCNTNLIACHIYTTID